VDKTDNTNLESWERLSFLSKITDTAPGIIYIFNRLTQSNEYANRSLGESLGYSVSEIQALGDAFLPTVMHPQDFKKVGPHFETLDALPDGEIAQLEFRVKHKMGGWVWLLAYETVFQRDESGAVIRHLGVASDITLQKNAQEEALEKRRLADAANEELRAFSYAMSHDMKSPSTTLNLLLEELKDQHWSSLDEDGRKLLDFSLQTTKRMSVLIEDVLKFTMVVGEQMQFESIELQPLIEDVIDDLKADIDAGKANIVVDKLPTVHGSELYLRILFQNLIANALKYRTPGVKPLISIGSRESEDEEAVDILVDDNGIGVAPEHHEKIFGMFERLHNRRDYPGTGLGLAICKRIALNHGGNITINSNLDSGAEFCVSLPRS